MQGYVLYARREGLVEKIAEGLDKSDILITSGGVSMGEKVGLI